MNKAMPSSPNTAAPVLKDPGAVLDQAAQIAGVPISTMIRLLDEPDPVLLERLFAEARRQRSLYFGNRVFMYGFLYISTHCRNHCRFCLYRRNNPRAARYRKPPEQVRESALELARSGVHLIDLTAGEDPRFYNDDSHGFDPVFDLIRSIKADTGLPVMASVGVVPEPLMDRLAESGADWYACYQETHNPELFTRLREGQSYDVRYRSKLAAKSRGMLIEEGLLCNVGETARDLLCSFSAMAGLDADQVRVMTFIPQSGTPMQNYPRIDALRERIVIALMRNIFPDLLIPASLDVDGLAGLRQRLDAGANVVTSLVPPGQGLAGVAQSALDIEDGRRTVEGIREILTLCGLEPADSDQYRNWVEHRRRLAFLKTVPKSPEMISRNISALGRIGAVR